MNSAPMSASFQNRISHIFLSITLAVFILFLATEGTFARNPLSPADSLTALLKDGGAYIQAKLYTKAEYYFMAALELDSINRNALKNLGLAHSMRGKYAKSRKYLEIAVTAKVADAQIYNSLGLTYSYLKMPEKSVDSYRKAIALDPENYDYNRNISGELITQGKFNDALLTLGKAIELQPNHGELRYLLGNAFSGLGDPQSAIINYHLAVENNYKSASLYYHLALAEEGTGNFWAAEEEFSKALALAPDSLEIRNRLGILYVQTSAFEHAVRVFQKNLDRNSNYVNSRIGLGWAYAFQGDEASANKQLEIIRRDYPEKIEVMKDFIKQGLEYYKASQQNSGADSTSR